MISRFLADVTNEQNGTNSVRKRGSRNLYKDDESSLELLNLSLKTHTQNEIGIQEQSLKMCISHVVGEYSVVL